MLTSIGWASGYYWSEPEKKKKNWIEPETIYLHFYIYIKDFERERTHNLIFMQPIHYHITPPSTVGTKKLNKKIIFLICFIYCNNVKQCIHKLKRKN